jgi:hypothetical protein
VRVRRGGETVAGHGPPEARQGCRNKGDEGDRCGAICPCTGDNWCFCSPSELELQVHPLDTSPKFVCYDVVEEAYQHSKGRLFCDAGAVGEGLLTGYDVS